MLLKDKYKNNKKINQFYKLQRKLYWRISMKRLRFVVTSSPAKE